MAEAQYMPDTTDFAGQFMRGAEFGQNFMQRRQRQQWETEDRAESQRARALMEPVLQAQRQATVATALSSLETNKQQQQLRTRFASEAPVYNKMFQDAMALPTFGEQQAALARIQPQVTWMGLIPEGKGFVDAVNNSRALAFQSQITDSKIKAEENAIRLRSDADLREISARGSEGRMNIMQQGLQNRMTQSARPTNNAFQRDAQRIEYLRQRANELRAIDPEGAELLETRAQYLSNPSNGSNDSFDAWMGGASAPTATPSPATQPAAAPKGPVTAPAVTDTRTVIDSIKF